MHFLSAKNHNWKILIYEFIEIIMEITDIFLIFWHVAQEDEIISLLLLLLQCLIILFVLCCE